MTTTPAQNRRAQRRAAFAQMASDMRERNSSARGAALEWAIESNESGGWPIGARHPGVVATMAVRQTLGQFHFPVEHDLRPLGMTRYSGHGAAAMTDGVINVEVNFRSLSGVRKVLDVPVMVHEGHVLPPVMLYVEGRAQVFSQSTLDDVIEHATFTRAEDARRSMFHPPPEQYQRRVVPVVHPGMFGGGQPASSMTAAKDGGHGQGEVSLNQDLYFVTAGGARIELPKGRKGRVMRDHGDALMIDFEVCTAMVQKTFCE